MSNSITVTPSTSLILIKRPIQSTIYLPSYSSDFTVTLRDTTGLISPTFPIIVSTTNGAILQDFSNRYIFNQPYGLVRFTFDTPRTWKILHTSGMPVESAAANVLSLNISTCFFEIFSTVTKTVSTMIVNTIQQTVDPITISGNVFLSNVSSPGFSLFKSSFVSYELMTVQGFLHVSGPVVFNSSFNVPYLSTVPSFVTVSSFTVGGAISTNTMAVVSTLTLNSTIQVETLALGRSSATGLVVLSSINTRLGISTLDSVSIANSLTANMHLATGNGFSTLGSISSSSYYIVGQSSIFQSSFVSFSSFGVNGVLLGQSTLFGDSLSIGSTLSVFGSTYTTLLSTSQLFSQKNIQVQGELYVNNTLQSQTVSSHFLEVGSTIQLTSSFIVGGTLSSASFLNTLSNVYVTSNVVLNNLSVGQDLGVGSSMDVRGSIYASSFNVAGSIGVLSSIDIGTNATFFQQSYFDGSLSKPLNATILGSTSVHGYFNVDRMDIQSLSVNQQFLDTPAINVTHLFSSAQVNINLNQAYINTGSSILNGTNALFSTLSLKTLLLSNYGTTIDTVYTESFQYLPSSAITTVETPYPFFVSSGSVFSQGFSSFTVSTSTIYANKFYGTFAGDAEGITNLFITEQNIRVSTLTTSSIYLFENANISSLYIKSLTTQSLSPNTISTQHLLLGFNYFDFTNTGNKIHFDVLSRYDSRQSVFINSTIYATSNSFLGINTKSPQHSLDINGSLYTSSLYYSSISLTDFIGESQSTTFAIASTIFIRDTLVSPAITITSLERPLYIVDDRVPLPTLCDSIQATSTSLVLNSMIQITNESVYPSQSMVIDATNTNFSNQTDSVLMVYGNTYATTLKTSSLDCFFQVSTPSMTFSTFILANESDYPYTPMKNSILTFGTDLLAINSTMFISQTLNTVGINTAPPDINITSNFLSIRSNAYFSTFFADSVSSGQMNYTPQIL